MNLKMAWCLLLNLELGEWSAIHLKLFLFFFGWRCNMPNLSLCFSRCFFLLNYWWPYSSFLIVGNPEICPNKISFQAKNIMDLFLGDFFTGYTIVNHYFSPPFGRICLGHGHLFHSHRGSCKSKILKHSFPGKFRAARDLFWAAEFSVTQKIGWTGDLQLGDKVWSWILESLRW